MNLIVKRVLTTLFLFFIPFSSIARLSGRPLIDSLLHKLPLFKEDTNKVNLLSRIATEFGNTNPDESIKYELIELALSQKLSWDKGVGRAYRQLGDDYTQKSNFSKAFDYYNRSIKIAILLKDSINTAVCFAKIANVYFYNRSFDTALIYYTKSFDVSRRIKYEDGMLNSLKEIGIIYGNQNKISKALEHFSEALRDLGDISKKGTGKLLTYIAVAYQKKGATDSALQYFQKSLEISTSIGDKSSISELFIYISSAYIEEKKFSNAIEFGLKSLKIEEQLGNKYGIANSLINLGSINYAKSNYPDALDCYYKAKNIYQELGDQIDVANMFQALATVYDLEGNSEKAISNLSESIIIYKNIGYRVGVVEALRTIGNIYSNNQEYSKATYYINEALGICKEIDNKFIVRDLLVNLGDLYFKQGKYAKAIESNMILLKIYKDQINNRSFTASDKNSFVLIQGNIGEDYLGLAKEPFEKNNNSQVISTNKTEYLKKAIEYLNKGYKGCKEINYTDGVIEYAKYLAEAYYLSGSYKKAFDLQLSYSNLKDSFYSGSNGIQKAMQELDQNIELKNKDLAIKNNQLLLSKLAMEKKRNWRIFYIASISLLLLVVFFIIKNLRNQSKANELLKLEKSKSEELLADLKVKNKAITDNIDYAQRIQSAILPNIKSIHKTFRDSFIIYLPKDIVSGDFYYFTETNDNFLVVAGDCTGHGVSGAFMSMIGTSLLNQIINDKGIEEPAMILNHLNISLIDTFQYSETESNDGMDISVSLFSLSDYCLQHAGANRPLWIIRNNELLIFKPDKYPIGGNHIAKDRMFTNSLISLQKNDTIYMFTDGYVDQFGGNNGKKLMNTNFKKILLSIQNMDMCDQEKLLKEYFEQWKGNNEQVDDVLLIGIRV